MLSNLLGFPRRLRLYLDFIKCRDIGAAQAYLDELRRRYSGEKRLEPAGFTVYSQADEDGIIAEIFRRIGMTNRQFVEFGSGDGRENNTAFLLLQGWTGLWMDGGRDYEATVRRLWGEELAQGSLKFQQANITPDNINALLSQNGVTGEIDFLGIDIDGNDYHVWTMIEVVRPRVVCVEYNAKFPPPVEWIMPRNDEHVWDGSDWFGASLSALEKLGRRKGYALVGCSIVGSNAFFVRNDIVEGKFAEPFTAEHHYQPPRYYLLFSRGHPPRS